MLVAPNIKVVWDEADCLSAIPAALQELGVYYPPVKDRPILHKFERPYDFDEFNERVRNREYALIR